jgi:hypothetical protein
MNTIKKGDIIRLHNGETCRVVGLPGTFMSNGSYEVIDVESTTEGKFLDIKKGSRHEGGVEIKYAVKKWVKPKDIAYSLTTTDHSDPITNYFETVYGEEGEIHIIPKDLESVELITDENGFKTVRLKYEGHLHNTVNILIGENEIKVIKNGTE